RSRWPIERDAMPLELIAGVKSIQAMPTPVVVSVVGVRREFQKDFARLPRLRGPNDKERLACRRPPAALHKRSAAILSRKCDAVIAALPIRRNLELERRRPAAAVRRTIIRRAMLFSLQFLLR